MKVHLISYGNNNFKNSKKRLYKEAENSKWFDTITIYGPEHLDQEFRNYFRNVLNKRRGGGYWIWKAYIIKKKLDEIKDNDILIYLDAGCTINLKGEERFRDYIKMLNDSKEGNISFHGGFAERIYTTKQIFKHFKVDINGEIAKSKQLVGGILLLKKTKPIINMINLVLKTYYDDPLLITDHYNKNQNSYFKDNRHDQSIFSMVRKILFEESPIKNETYFRPFGNLESLKYPFWATRKR